MQETLEIGRGRMPYVEVLFDAQRTWLRLVRGPAAGARVVPSVTGARFVAPYWFADALASAVAAWAHHESGCAHEARAAFETVAAKGFDDLERDEHWLTSLALLARLAVAFGDRDQAERLHGKLLLLRELGVSHDLVQALAGSIEGVLGTLALLLGPPSRAAEHLEAALAREAALGARPAFVRTRLDLAAAVRAGRSGGGADRARRLGGEARAEAQRLGDPPAGGGCAGSGLNPEAWALPATSGNPQFVVGTPAPRSQPGPQPTQGDVPEAVDLRG